jgi:hypothetical protein
MGENDLRRTGEKLNDALNKLVEVRDQLEEVNRVMGAMARFEAMKQEIRDIGWDGILAKYHPDNNLDDPAAFPLFEMYKFSYDCILQGR